MFRFPWDITDYFAVEFLIFEHFISNRLTGFLVENQKNWIPLDFPNDCLGYFMKNNQMVKIESG